MADAHLARRRVDNGVSVLGQVRNWSAVAALPNDHQLATRNVWTNDLSGHSIDVTYSHEKILVSEGSGLNDKYRSSAFHHLEVGIKHVSTGALLFLVCSWII